jgi:lipoic acid synthetase
VTLPRFLVKSVPKQENIRRIRRLIDDSRIHTVCESASCPNIGECFSKKILTFMILGEICTRNCRFCGVSKGKPLPPDPGEARRVAEAAQKLKLNYVVVTSVTRDDLPDGGARQFATVIKALKSAIPMIKVEVLIPDFKGSKEALNTVLEAGPFVLNHNLETVPRLYPAIRPQANYRQSVELLRRVKEQKKDTCTEKSRGIYTKSGFMVGLGESRNEIFQVVNDLKQAGCDLVTIGQYLAPSKEAVRVARYVDPEEFKEFKSYGEKIGLKVYAGPFVRSSYRAKEAAETLT